MQPGYTLGNPVLHSDRVTLPPQHPDNTDGQFYFSGWIHQTSPLSLNPQPSSPSDSSRPRPKAKPSSKEIDQPHDSPSTNDRSKDKPSTKRIPSDKQQVNVYLRKVTVEAGKNAAYSLIGKPGAPNSWSTLVDEAVAAYVVNLANKFNAGKPFPTRSGTLPSGPRIR